MFFEPPLKQNPKQNRVIDNLSASLTVRRIFRFVIICILAFGILLRFANLDLKPYWLDEAFTSLRLAGYSDAEVTQQIENRILTIQELQKYQQPAPEKTSLDTIAQLAVREPQLTPLYFVLLRSWAQIFGSSIATLRSLSAVFSILTFPALYWLCLELFGSRRTAWTAIAIVAVSPIHLLYAQEARPLSLWILMIVLSSASLLRAMREPTKANWAIYAAAIAAGLYSHLFTVFLSIGHGVYAVVQERFRFGKTFTAFAFSSIVGWLTFVPWIVFGLLANRQAMIAQSQAIPTKDLVKGWFRGISLIFVDLSLNEQSPRLYFLLFLAVFFSVLGFVGATLFFFGRSAPRKAQIFVLTMIAVPFVFLTMSDFAAGASRSVTARYLLSAYLGIQLMAAYVLTEGMLSLKYQKVWVVLTGFVLLIGCLSCGVMAQSEMWWSKADANAERQLAQVINQSTKPIVITDDYFVKLLSFSHSLAPDVHVQVLPQFATPTIPQGFSDVFLYRPSDALQKQLATQYDFQIIEAPLLWKLQQKNR